ncbi:MAG: tRNA U-34 5-methylaminomethyl-2-thiouridine biosynthesis protein [Bdellovibrionales bacterium]|nr:tRNA U-34 5-methylaminomethyl-2-thiouridine biosynthesis protein [Bdellovibrionales bacterium]
MGKIIAGILAPHPPHLVYAENPPQNEPKAECGWETLRWAYENCREKILEQKPDVFLVHSPHWQTVVGHHVLGLEQFSGLSVDPIFPHLFRYKYDLKVDVDLSLAIAEEGKNIGLTMKVMSNPKFRIDYGSITSCHLMNPAWDIPIVCISSNNSPYYFSNEVGQQEMFKLGEATRKAIEKSGKRCVLLASNSLSHRHFTTESEIPEDMSYEHIYHHGQYLWDMQMLDLMKQGKSQQLLDVLPEFMDMTVAEVKAGALAWMLSALGMPEYPAKIHGYGTVIGTGNAVVEWNAERAAQV